MDIVTTLFLHGLDSSGSGTKGRYFSKYFPSMVRPDFDGTLHQRMAQLNEVIIPLSELVIVGSSFGGLMGACLCCQQPDRVKRLIMLAPALNFPEYQPPGKKIGTESILVIGEKDIVTPPEIVIPAAKATFSQLEIRLVDDDHLLHSSFYTMDWQTLLA